MAGLVLAAVILGAVFGLVLIWRARSGRTAPVRRRGATARSASTGGQVRRPAAAPVAEEPSAHFHVSRASAGLVVDEIQPTFYDDVASMLERRLKQEPARTDLHTALLDLHHASGRADAFLAAAAIFAKTAGTEQWTRVTELGRELGLDLSGMRDTEPSRASPSPPVGGGTPVSGAPVGARLRHYDYDGIDAAELGRRLQDLRSAYGRLRRNPAFQAQFADVVSRELARPTPLQHAASLSALVGGASIYLKREDQREAHTDLVLAMLGQALVARATRRRRLICGSRSGGAALACARAAHAVQLRAVLFVPADVDAAPLAAFPEVELNRVAPGPLGDADPRRDALTHWIDSGQDSLYVTGLKAGPDPYPAMVIDFQTISAAELARQLAALGHAEPAAVVGSVEAGLASVGVCQPFLERGDVTLAMANAPAAADSTPRPLREHALLAATGRVQYADVDDDEAASVAALGLKHEKLQLSPSNARAVALAMRMARRLPGEAAVVALLGGTTPG